MPENDAEMLTRLGTDAAAWTEEFLKVNTGKLGLGRDDVDFDVVRSWFANAIEAGASRDALKLARLEQFALRLHGLDHLDDEQAQYDRRTITLAQIITAANEALGLTSGGENPEVETVPVSQGVSITREEGESEEDFGRRADEAREGARVEAKAKAEGGAEDALKKATAVWGGPPMSQRCVGDRHYFGGGLHCQCGKEPSVREAPPEA